MSQFERVIGPLNSCLPVALFCFSAFGCIQWLNMTWVGGLFCGPHLGLIDRAISWESRLERLPGCFFHAMQSHGRTIRQVM
jgi:hypothetical protein